MTGSTRPTSGSCTRCCAGARGRPRTCGVTSPRPAVSADAVAPRPADPLARFVPGQLARFVPGRAARPRRGSPRVRPPGRPRTLAPRLRRAFTGRVRGAFGADDENATTAAVRQRLRGAGHELVAPTAAGRPALGAEVGRAVATAAADLGVAMCWTGTRVATGANKA